MVVVYMNENEIPYDRLKSCPFCGTHDNMLMDYNRLNRMPRMDGKLSPIITVVLVHWCPPTEGQPSSSPIKMVGRDLDSVIALWNRRA
jgi:hypothetical protein